LFEVLSGKQPYEATTPMGVILKHITEPAPRLLAVKADLPEELEAIISRSMEKNRDQRYPTAGAMASDLSLMFDGQKKAALGPVERIAPAEKPPTWHSPAGAVKMNRISPNRKTRPS
jgi:serine/threonine-protein kinase